MNIGIARPGYFTDKKYQPSMQTNWINYDLLADALIRNYDAKITTIGFQKTSGADRMLSIVGLSEIQHNPKKFRTKTQQAVTSSVLLESNDSLLDGLDLLIMPYYTFFEERCYYYTLAYQAASYGIPLMLWDTDANFIGQVSSHCDRYRITQVRDKVFKDPVYINDRYVDIDLIDDLKLVVLTPAINGPLYSTYFPFFPIFEKKLKYKPERKQYDAVYAGSQYQREELFLKYYDSKLYDAAVVGKYNAAFMQQWKHSDTFYKGHIPRMDVQKFLSSGRVCIHIARGIYQRYGHITPRVYEVINSGTLLLLDSSLAGSRTVCGNEFVINKPEDVCTFLENGDPYIASMHEKQKESPFIRTANPDFNAEIIMRVMNNKNSGPAQYHRGI